MAELVAAGVDRVVGIVLTPHQSSLGSDSYLERAEAAVTATPPASGPPWRSCPCGPGTEHGGFAELLAERTERSLASLATSARRKVALFFTAHSLPRRSLAKGDPYPRQVAESATDVATRLGLDDVEGLTWAVAWQSAGRTADPWIGPEPAGRDRPGGRPRAPRPVVVCPVGFVADHLEILYDLDIEAARAATARGLAFTRTASLNDDPRFCAVLARAVESAAAAHPSAEAASPANEDAATATGSGARHG